MIWLAIFFAVPLSALVAGLFFAELDLLRDARRWKREQASELACWEQN